MIEILFLMEPKNHSTSLLCYIYSLVLFEASIHVDHFNCQQLMHLKSFGHKIWS